MEVSKAAQSQIEKDRKLSRRGAKQIAPKKRWYNIGNKLTVVKEVAQEYAETTLVVIYIINGVLASAILFDIVSASEKVRYMVAAFAIAYSAIGFILFINRGVKHQIAERKAKVE